MSISGNNNRHPNMQQSQHQRDRGMRIGGRRGNRHNDDPKVAISKTLSKILRHKAKDHGLLIDPNGFVRIRDLLALPLFKNVTLENIKELVNTDSKQRYELKAVDHEDTWIIRARQGHSLEFVEIDHEKITDPKQIPVVVHGTYLNKWPLIEKNGLSRMTRTHIHMSQGLFGEEGVISGMRKNCNLYIYIDVDKAIASGISFEKSSNGVILSKGIDGIIPKEYFKSVVEKQTGNVLYKNQTS